MSRGRGSRLATCYSKALKRLRNLQYVRRPRLDLGCSAIGWMDGCSYSVVETTVKLDLT
jgi:hypothetical protein